MSPKRALRVVHPFLISLAAGLVFILYCSAAAQAYSNEYSGSGEEEEEDWGSGANGSNGTGNYTELCSGLIDTNSSEVIYSNTTGGDDEDDGSADVDAPVVCGNILYDYLRCKNSRRPVISLVTDSLGYQDGRTDILAEVDHNATEDYSVFYYKLCHSTVFSIKPPQVIHCAANGTTMTSDFTWVQAGRNRLTVYVFTNSSFKNSSFLGCNTTEVTVAKNSDLTLRVKLGSGDEIEDGETFLTTNTEGSDDEDDDETVDVFTIGNITFIATAKLNSSFRNATDYYYKFVVSDGDVEESTDYMLESNLTRDYSGVGDYNYTVHAIALLRAGTARHASFSGDFALLKAVSEALIQVGGNNSIKVGSTVELIISAEGSTPIFICWYQTQLQTKNVTAGTEGEEDDNRFLPTEFYLDKENKSWTPIWECIVLNNSNETETKEYRTFNQLGMFQYVANFSNKASHLNRNFTFQVVPGPSPAVVASSATAVVVFAIIIAIVVFIVALIVGGYIPYRRYKNRMTETADFRFVDLSETSSHWERLKLKTNQFVDYFRRRRHSEKIGLVNLDSVLAPDERQSLYGTADTLTQFTPYETI